MSLEIILDLLLSAIVLAIYHADCEQQPAMAYACTGGELPLFGNHEEFYKQRMVRPEDYESSSASHLITSDDAWVTDPMDTLAEMVETLDVFVPEDLELGELFAAADAIEPIAPEVAAELAAIDAEVERFYVETEPARTKVATVAQLRAIAKVVSRGPVKGSKAQLTELVLNSFAYRGILQYVLGDLTFITSDDDQSVLVILK